MIRAIAFGVVCLAGVGAIGATAKKSASPLSEVFPTVTGNKGDRLSFADGQDTLSSADRVDVAYVSPTDRGKLATLQSGNQTKNGLAPSTHIHGALDRNPQRYTELVLSDQDFGEFYLRRRVVPDFIYDADRLFHLVLVGYSANDPPMRYLLNAVAADGSRFDDLKERFTFFGTDAPDPVALEDWKARGITPIHYGTNGNHGALHLTLER